MRPPPQPDSTAQCLLTLADDLPPVGDGSKKATPCTDLHFDEETETYTLVWSIWGRFPAKAGAGNVTNCSGSKNDTKIHQD